MKKDASNSFHIKMKGFFWILIGVVFVPPLSMLWLQPLGLYTPPPQTSSYFSWLANYWNSYYDQRFV